MSTAGRVYKSKVHCLALYQCEWVTHSVLLVDWYGGRGMYSIERNIQYIMEKEQNYGK